jgi:spermidine/putrescine transport system ATP-binding protein
MTMGLDTVAYSSFHRRLVSTQPRCRGALENYFLIVTQRLCDKRYFVQATEERAAGARLESNPAATNTPAVEVTNVSRRFGDVTALAGVSLSVRRGEFFSLLGPSGCGKTTLLRIIAGLDLAETGTLRIGGEDAARIPAHKRPVNTVFQSYALFPHLNVRDNVAFGLRMKKTPPLELERRVNQVMATVQISDLAQRRPAQLSGGQMQRVALARAIVNEPQVLLLDEPLGALDLKLRQQLQMELHTLQRRLGMTFIYVTHDQEEALVMSDRIAVMNGGRVEQLGPAQELYERPRTCFVAQFLGSCNLIKAVAQRCAGRRMWARTSFGELEIELDDSARSINAGDPCTLTIRPEKVVLNDSVENGETNCFVTRIVDLIYTGSETQYLLEGPGGPLKAWVLNTRVGHQGLHLGQEIAVRLPAAALVLLDD